MTDEKEMPQRDALRRVNGRLRKRYHFATSTRVEVSPGITGNRFWNEIHAAVAHRGQESTGVIAARSATAQVRDDHVRWKAGAPLVREGQAFGVMVDPEEWIRRRVLVFQFLVVVVVLLFQQQERVGRSIRDVPETDAAVLEATAVELRGALGTATAAVAAGVHRIVLELGLQVAASRARTNEGRRHVLRRELIVRIAVRAILIEPVIGLARWCKPTCWCRSAR